MTCIGGRWTAHNDNMLAHNRRFINDFTFDFEGKHLIFYRLCAFICQFEHLQRFLYR